jgi:hypothetical protein
MWEETPERWIVRILIKLEMYEKINKIVDDEDFCDEDFGDNFSPGQTVMMSIREDIKGCITKFRGNCLVAFMRHFPVAVDQAILDKEEDFFCDVQEGVKKIALIVQEIKDMQTTPPSASELEEASKQRLWPLYEPQTTEEVTEKSGDKRARH